MNQCINVELITLYNLTGFSSIEYCTQKEIGIKIGKKFNRKNWQGESMFKVEYLNLFAFFLDALDIFFVVACSILIAVVCISSRYDEKLRIGLTKSSKAVREDVEHFKIAPPTLSMEKIVNELDQ